MKTIIIIINEEESLRCEQTERLREDAPNFIDLIRLNNKSIMEIFTGKPRLTGTDNTFKGIGIIKVFLVGIQTNIVYLSEKGF